MSYKETAMPTYAYKCGSCSKDFDKFLTFKQYDDTKLVVNCDGCGSPKTTRLLSATAFVFDGDPKTVGTWAERNYSKLGEASRSRIEQKKVEDRETQRQVISPKSSGVIQTPSEVKSKWPKLSKDALKKMDIKEYITSDCEPKEM